MEQEKVKTKTRSVMSWGQLFIIFATTLCFIYALTLHANLKPPAELVGYTFRGSQIYRYEGTETEVKIPSSYSYGATYEFKGKTVFREQYQAREFLQEHFAVGSEGYYDFYNQIYTKKYPLIPYRDERIAFRGTTRNSPYRRSLTQIRRRLLTESTGLSY